MSFMYCGTYLLEDVHNPLEWQRFFLRQHVAERAAIEIFHHEVSNLASIDTCESKVRNINYVWVSKSTGGASLTLKALDKFFVAHELRRDEFECDVAGGTQVSCEIDSSHSTGPEYLFEPVF